MPELTTIEAPPEIDQGLLTPEIPKDLGAFSIDVKKAIQDQAANEFMLRHRLPESGGASPEQNSGTNLNELEAAPPSGDLADLEIKDGDFNGMSAAEASLKFEKSEISSSDKVMELQNLGGRWVLTLDGRNIRHVIEKEKFEGENAEQEKIAAIERMAQVESDLAEKGRSVLQYEDKNGGMHFSIYALIDGKVIVSHYNEKAKESIEDGSLQKPPQLDVPTVPRDQLAQIAEPVLPATSKTPAITEKVWNLLFGATAKEIKDQQAANGQKANQNPFSIFHERPISAEKSAVSSRTVATQATQEKSSILSALTLPSLHISPENTEQVKQNQTTVEAVGSDQDQIYRPEFGLNAEEPEEPAANQLTAVKVNPVEKAVVGQKYTDVEAAPEFEFNSPVGPDSNPDNSGGGISLVPDLNNVKYETEQFTAVAAPATEMQKLTNSEIANIESAALASLAEHGIGLVLEQIPAQIQTFEKPAAIKFAAPEKIKSAGAAPSRIIGSKAPVVKTEAQPETHSEIPNKIGLPTTTEQPAATDKFELRADGQVRKIEKNAPGSSPNQREQQAGAKIRSITQARTEQTQREYQALAAFLNRREIQKPGSASWQGSDQDSKTRTDLKKSPIRPGAKQVSLAA